MNLTLRTLAVQIEHDTNVASYSEQDAFIDLESTMNSVFYARRGPVAG